MVKISRLDRNTANDLPPTVKHLVSMRISLKDRLFQQELAKKYNGLDQANRLMECSRAVPDRNTRPLSAESMTLYWIIIDSQLAHGVFREDECWN